jgi:hypothetical protein
MTPVTIFLKRGAGQPNLESSIFKLAGAMNNSQPVRLTRPARGLSRNTLSTCPRNT